jgi:hypothetical protein
MVFLGVRLPAAGGARICVALLRYGIGKHNESLAKILKRHFLCLYEMLTFIIIFCSQRFKSYIILRRSNWKIVSEVSNSSSALLSRPSSTRRFQDSQLCLLLYSHVIHNVSWTVRLIRIMPLHCLRTLCNGDVALTRAPKPNLLKHNMLQEDQAEWSHSTLKNQAELLRFVANESRWIVAICH